METPKSKKRVPGYPITINKNVDAVKAKVQSLCNEHGISASILFEAVIDMQTDEQWQAYALEAKKRKFEKSRAIRETRLGLTKLSRKDLDEVTAVLQAKGIDLFKV